jgi:hypothetical protein
VDYICNTLQQIGKKDYKNEAKLNEPTELGSPVLNETVHVAGQMIEVDSPSLPKKSRRAHSDTFTAVQGLLGG